MVVKHIRKSRDGKEWVIGHTPSQPYNTDWPSATWDDLQKIVDASSRDLRDRYVVTFFGLTYPSGARGFSGVAHIVDEDELYRQLHVNIAPGGMYYGLPFEEQVKEWYHLVFGAPTHVTGWSIKAAAPNSLRIGYDNEGDISAPLP